MPVFNYNCHKCSHEFKQLTRAGLVAECPECGTVVAQELPTGGMTRTLETKDAYRGKQLPKNLDRQLKSRMRNHADKYETADKIDEHGMDDAKRHGWTKKGKKL